MTRLRRFIPDPAALRTALLVAAGVAAASELKVYPFGTEFRFGLGPPVLAFCLLLLPRLSPLLTGLVTGMAVLLFRSLLTLLSQAPPEATQLLPELLHRHGAAAAYYVGMALLFHLVDVRGHVRRPLYLLVFMVLVDGGPNLLELFIRTMGLPANMIGPVLLVALIRGSMVAGLYFLVVYQQAEVRWQEQQGEYRRLLMLLTGLHAEVFLLQKSSQEMEQVMARSHKLHQDLRDQPDRALSALEIARSVHEVKKDYQRILSGLGRLVRRKDLPAVMSFDSVVEMVREVNGAYARQLGKQIELEVQVEPGATSAEYMHWVSILNNLVTNAIEASGPEGRVRVEVRHEGGELVVTVTDQGPGIPDTDWDVIFHPGFSTKVNPETGAFSTGLGLSHVRNLAQSMGGQVSVTAARAGGTAFAVRCPAGTQGGES